MTVKKTYPKILLLIISSSIIFIILYFSLYYYTKKVENDVFKNSTQQFDNEVSRLLSLESMPIKVAINNDSNWDEFVTFTTKTKDKKWFTETIGNEIDIYKVDYLGTYGVDKKFIMKIATSKIKSIDFIPIEAINVIEKKGIYKFYMKIPEGIIEVTGASIHPSDDPLKNKTKSSGYFFVIRLIDAAFLKNLEKITNSKIEINTNKGAISSNNHKIFATINLNDYEKKPVVKIHFERNFDIYFEKIIDVLLLIIITFIVSLLFNFYYIRKLVYYPLGMITKALLFSDRSAVRKLQKTTGEFSYIGNLFEENYKQKKQLINAKIKAEEGDRLKSSFLANLSHEIRTPMNAINGFTDLIINTNLSEAEKIEYLKIIDASGKNLVSIIDDLIEMSKIDSNLIEPNFVTFNLESCMNELYETINITIPKNKSIAFNLIQTKKPTEYNIVSDAIKLKQIITNLVTNAIKFTDNGTVSFGYEVIDSKKQIKFAIKDTGLGIDDKNQQYIFDRFKRVDSDFSIKVGGLGLGLSITKAYVEMLGGTISLKSALGKGSEFTFTIPLEYDKAETIIVHQVFNDKTETNKEEGLLLIAEDDNINFVLFEKLMKQKNYKILRAINGSQAVEICLNNPNIDLVLMDIKMPIMDGFEALELIKPIRPNLPIIAQTAYSSAEDEDKIYAAGFSDYITKPLNRERLFELINHYINEN